MVLCVIIDNTIYLCNAKTIFIAVIEFTPYGKIDLNADHALNYKAYLATMDFSTYNIYDYDKLTDYNIDTKVFTDLTDVEIIDEKHPFIAFLNGFSHYLTEGEILHGWYHTSKTQIIVNIIPSGME